MNYSDDASYKTPFSAPEVVRDLILGFIPDDWLRGFDYHTLERVSGSYVTDDLRDRADDIVWRVKVGGDWVYLYILPVRPRPTGGNEEPGGGGDPVRAPGPRRLAHRVD